MAARLAVGCLGIVDVADTADDGDGLLAVRESGIGSECGSGFRARQAERPGGGEGGGGVLLVVRAGQGVDARKIGHRGLVLVEYGVEHRDAACDLAADADGDQCPAAAGLEIGEHGAARLVVGADDRHLPAARPAAKDAPLRRDVARQIAVPVQMVGADVEEDSSVETRLLDQVELKGGAFEDIDAGRSESRERKGGRAEIAADRHRPSGVGEQVSDQGGGRRLAVRAGYADHPRFRRRFAQQFDIADHRTGGAAGAHHHRMGLRVGQRHAGAQDQGVEGGPVPAGGFAHPDPGRGRGAALRRDIVPGQHRGAAVAQSRRSGQPRAAEAEKAEGLAAAGGDKHRPSAA